MCSLCFSDVLLMWDRPETSRSNAKITKVSSYKVLLSVLLSFRISVLWLKRSGRLLGVRREIKRWRFPRQRRDEFIEQQHWAHHTQQRSQPVHQAVVQEGVSTAGELCGEGQGRVEHGSSHTSTWTHKQQQQQQQHTLLPWSDICWFVYSCCTQQRSSEVLKWTMKVLHRRTSMTTWCNQYDHVM